MFKLVQQPTFETDGVEIVNYEYLLSPSLQEMRKVAYGAFTPARNAKNGLCRGLRWGVLLDNVLRWSTRDSYQLSAEFNGEEAGRVRTMDLIPTKFLDHPAIRRVIDDVFSMYYPDTNRAQQPYIVQLSAIRYEPQHNRTCYPSPDAPHQDAFDNAIVVLGKTDNLIGGQSRVFTIEDEALVYEANLEAGQALFVRDMDWKHQVLPMMQDVSDGSGSCHRDILIVRIDPANR